MFSNHKMVTAVWPVAAQTSLVQVPASALRTQFAEVYSAHWAQVYRCIARIVKDEELTNDLTAEIFAKLYETGLNQFHGDSKLSTWLYRVATNHALDYRKRLCVRRTVYLQDWQNWMGENEEHCFVTDCFVTEKTPESLYLEEEERYQQWRTLQQGLSQLSQLEQLLIKLSLEGESMAEIARTAQIAPGTVRSRLHRARQRLINSRWKDN